MERRLLVVSRIDKDGNQSYYTTYFNAFSGKYNLTTLLMHLHGCNNLWDKALREKYEKEIYTGKNGKNVYAEFGTDVFFCHA